MAIVTATITVDFTAFYTGDHRVCWRVQGSGDPYDCTTVVSCAGAGGPCQAIFTADVNTTSCDGIVTFEGYVQATCEDEASLNGRLPFTVDFTPTQLCNRYEVTCDYVGVLNIQASNTGQEYQPGDAVVFTRDGGDGQTVDAVGSVFTVASGTINSIGSLLNAGTGYVASEVLNIVDGGGSGAGATITIDTVGGSGEILTFTLSAGGSGYIGPFTFTGGSGAGADFEIIAGSNYAIFGSVDLISISTPGQYEIPPTISITSGTGSGYAGTPNMADCITAISVARDCVGGDSIDIEDLSLGETFALCTTDLSLTLSADYSSVQVGCCIPADTAGDPCVEYQIENTGGDARDVIHMVCEGDYAVVTVPNGVTAVVCAVEGGIIDPGFDNIIITNTGTPCS